MELVQSGRADREVLQLLLLGTKEKAPIVEEGVGEDHELYEEVRHEMYIQQHGSPDEKRRLKQKEEQEYTNLVEGQLGLPVVDESVEREARKAQIEEALNKPASAAPTVANLGK